MKALHLISGGDTGGAKTSVLTLLSELKELMGIKLVCFIEADFFRASVDLGIDGLVLPQRSRFDLSVVDTLVKMVETEGYDLINCHGARANFIGAFLKKRVNIPMITTVHSDYMHDFDNSLYKKIIYTAFNAWSLRKMEYYIVMAIRFKKDLIKRGYKEDVIFEAYNGISMKSAPGEIMSRDVFIKKYNIPYRPENIYVGSATRLHPIKGVDVLLRAAKRVKEHNSNIKFLIAGTGDEKYIQKYHAYVKENDLEDTVTFLGFVEEMDTFYQLIHINTISSHSEAVCYALLEGGKYYKPSVASRVGGIPELLEDGVCGILFEDDNDDEYARKILDLIADEELMKSLGLALYQKVEKNFSEAAMAARVLTIYTEIMKRCEDEKKV